MLCPICKLELKIAERQGIEIDYCPQCRGVWLDRGELDKLIERAATGGSVLPSQAMPQPGGWPAYSPAVQPPPPTPYYKGDYDDDDDRYRKSGYSKPEYRENDYYRKKKKESFLGDLFDF